MFMHVYIHHYGIFLKLDFPRETELTQIRYSFLTCGVWFLGPGEPGRNPGGGCCR